MLDCPRCFTLVDGGSAYCAVCGRPRIVEGLRVPIAQRPWTRFAWRGVIVLFSIWLLVTVGVASLREAKAVRDSRKLLEEKRNQEAWSLLDPFLKTHPEHLQALFLCGKATVRLRQWAEAKQCLAGLSDRSPELAKKLGKDYQLTLTEQARALGCDVSTFAQLLAWEAELGPSHSAGVITSLDRVIEACRTGGNYAELSRLAALMAESGQAKAMIEKGYVPAIRQAVAQARYADARALAQQAVSVVPDGTAAVEAVLAGERKKVAATVATLRRLCTTLGTDPQFWTGNSWCFPTAGPPVIQSARDGWGNPITYSPIVNYGEQECHQGFTLGSYGSDGTVTQGDRQSPTTDIFCRHDAQWGESWQLPDQFWLVASGH